MEFADRDPAEPLEPVLEEIDHRRIVDPAADLAAPAIGAQAGQDEAGRGGVERAGPGIARTRNQRPFQSGLLHKGDRVRDWIQLCRIVAEMDMGVEDRHRSSVAAAEVARKRRRENMAGLLSAGFLESCHSWRLHGKPGCRATAPNVAAAEAGAQRKFRRED